MFRTHGVEHIAVSVQGVGEVGELPIVSRVDQEDPLGMLVCEQPLRGRRLAPAGSSLQDQNMAGFEDLGCALDHTRDGNKDLVEAVQFFCLDLPLGYPCLCGGLAHA
jgi:hypothetical protein